MNNNSESNGAEYTVKKVLRNQFDLKLSSKKRKNTGLIENIKSGRVNIIAEIKKASPSRGLINPGLDVTDTALTYDRYSSFICGISVITEPVYFKGSTDFLIEVKKVSDLPVLRKDFIFHEYQVYESAAMGADCILLISSILGYKKLNMLYNLALKIGLDVLVEVHDKNEFDKVLRTGANFIGINNRDLKTMKINTDTARQVLRYSKDRMVSKIVLVCESGIEDINYIEELYSMGINTFLVGSYFMKSSNLDYELGNMETELAKRGLI